jgi:hypothetical protein
MKTVWIYIDRRQQVGSAEYLKGFATADAANNGSRKTIRKACRSNMRCSNEAGRRLRRR